MVRTKKSKRRKTTSRKKAIKRTVASAPKQTKIKKTRVIVPPAPGVTRREMESELKRVMIPELAKLVSGMVPLSKAGKLKLAVEEAAAKAAKMNDSSSKRLIRKMKKKDKMVALALTLSKGRIDPDTDPDTE